jgi:integrase
MTVLDEHIVNEVPMFSECVLGYRAWRIDDNDRRIAFLLGHRDANVTRAVYVRELADTRRRAMRRSRMVAEFSDILKP